jgi:predicted phage terminase large subunit-like protein
MNNKIIKMKSQELKRTMEIELAKRDFWYFCHLMIPKFYRKEHTYLKEWCKIMQELYEDEKSLMKMEMISGPPRHGKSLTSALFCAWLIGKNNNVRLGVITYSKVLSIKFSKSVRNIVLEKKINKTNKNHAGKRFTFEDVFPDISLEDKSVENWKIRGATETTFLVASIKTTITGFGFDFLIIDDIIKDPTESYNEKILVDRTEYISNVVSTRLEGNKKLLMIMHRWGETDVSARIKEVYPNVREHCYKTKGIDGKMLNPSIMDEQVFEETKDVMRKGDGLNIFYAQYQQEFIETEDQLYKLKKYPGSVILPNDVTAVLDTADKGSDKLCLIAFVKLGELIYIKDVYYTDKPMDKTEDEVVEFLFKNNVRKLISESNNGGNTYSRNIKHKYNKKYGTRCLFRQFTQTQNKETRILSNAAWVNEYIIIPDDAAIRFEDFYLDVHMFKRIFKLNKHDDCADCLTIIAENYSEARKKKAKVLTNILKW